jgi:hypothetical protein
MGILQHKIDGFVQGNGIGAKGGFESVRLGGSMLGRRGKRPRKGAIILVLIVLIVMGIRMLGGEFAIDKIARRAVRENGRPGTDLQGPIGRLKKSELRVGPMERTKLGPDPISRYHFWNLGKPNS